MAQSLWLLSNQQDSAMQDCTKRSRDLQDAPSLYASSYTLPALTRTAMDVTGLCTQFNSPTACVLPTLPDRNGNALLHPDIQYERHS